MSRYVQVRELVKDPSLRVTEIAMKTGYNKGHVSRLRKEAIRQALETEQKTAVSPGKGTGFNYFRASAITVLRQAQEPVAWISDSPTKGNGKQLHWTKAEAWRWSSNITPLYTAPPQRKPLTPREIELLDGMIEVQLQHAAQCDGIANRTMAEKQKSWDMERVALLCKLREKNT